MDRKRARPFALVPVFLLLASSAAWPASSPNGLSHLLRSQIQGYNPQKSKSFESLLTQWEKNFGTRAVTPLLSLVSDTKLADHQRYIALMGAARLGGKPAANSIVPFLQDPSWMIRSAALRALTALNDPQTSQAVLPLLKDPALVVRLEAVEAVEKLRPAGSATALVATVEDRANYHGGKAQWVPQRALAALKSIELAGSNEIVPRLEKIRDQEKDPSFRRQVARVVAEIKNQ